MLEVEWLLLTCGKPTWDGGVQLPLLQRCHAKLRMMVPSHVCSMTYRLGDEVKACHGHTGLLDLEISIHASRLLYMLCLLLGTFFCSSHSSLFLYLHTSPQILGRQEIYLHLDVALVLVSDALNIKHGYRQTAIFL